MLQAPVFQLTADENGFFSLPDLPFDAVSVLPGSQSTIHQTEVLMLPSTPVVKQDPDPSDIPFNAVSVESASKSTTHQSEKVFLPATPAVQDPPVLPQLPRKRSKLSLRRKSVIVGGGGKSPTVTGAGIFKNT